MRKHWIAMIMILTVLLCACVTPKNVDVKPSPDEFNIMDSATQQYTYDELVSIANYTGGIDQYASTYPMECIRQKGVTYRLAYRGESHVAVIYFDATGTKTLGRVYTASTPVSELNSVMRKTLEDVREIDPNGDYIFLYTGRNDDRTSIHYTSDGFVVRITYDEKHVVVDIETELI